MRVNLILDFWPATLSRSLVLAGCTDKVAGTDAACRAGAVRGTDFVLLDTFSSEFRLAVLFSSCFAGAVFNLVLESLRSGILAGCFSRDVDFTCIRTAAAADFADGLSVTLAEVEDDDGTFACCLLLLFAVPFVDADFPGGGALVSVLPELYSSFLPAVFPEDTLSDFFSESFGFTFGSFFSSAASLFILSTANKAMSKQPSLQMTFKGVTYTHSIVVVKMR